MNGRYKNIWRGGKNISYDQIKREKADIERKIQNIEKQLCHFPEGKLICVHNGKYLQWRISNGKNKIYIPKNESHLLEQMAIKKYLTLQHNTLLHEKQAIEAYLNNYNPEVALAEENLLKSKEYQPILSPYFKTKSEELKLWEEEPYERYDGYPEGLRHKTYSGIYVRSKAESMICAVLYKYGIPFRYEWIQEIDGMLFYPDFTIRHPVSGKLYYWEHFGKMDDPVYSRRAFEKMQLFNSRGIVPTIHLITTFETREEPLEISTVEEIVKHYFL